MVKDLITELKKKIETKQIIIGKKEVLKNLFNSKISDIYISLKCPDDLKQDIERYSATEQINIVELKVTSDELGTICKKSYPISVLGILKEKK